MNLSSEPCRLDGTLLCAWVFSCLTSAAKLPSSQVAIFKVASQWSTACTNSNLIPQAPYSAHLNTFPASMHAAGVGDSRPGPDDRPPLNPVPSSPSTDSSTSDEPLKAKQPVRTIKELEVQSISCRSEGCKLASATCFPAQLAAHSCACSRLRVKKMLRKLHEALLTVLGQVYMCKPIPYASRQQAPSSGCLPQKPSKSRGPVSWATFNSMLQSDHLDLRVRTTQLTQLVTGQLTMVSRETTPIPPLGSHTIHVTLCQPHDLPTTAFS